VFPLIFVYKRWGLIAFSANSRISFLSVASWPSNAIFFISFVGVRTKHNIKPNSLRLLRASVLLHFAFDLSYRIWISSKFLWEKSRKSSENKSCELSVNHESTKSCFETKNLCKYLLFLIEYVSGCCFTVLINSRVCTAVYSIANNFAWDNEWVNHRDFKIVHEEIHFPRYSNDSRMMSWSSRRIRFSLPCKQNNNALK
jgi:hypothetical protein